MTKKIDQWIWRWHVIAGLICLPIVVLLAFTGALYLFKDNYEQPKVDTFKHIEPSQNSQLSFQEQWNMAKAKWDRSPTGLILPEHHQEASQFISGKFSHKSVLFLNPYTGKVNGEIIQNKTDMYKVRKLHGELLMGKFGTKIVELVACWMIVLILSGIYIFLPRNKTLKSLFTIRLKQGKRILYRDVHTVLGFWFSILILLILMGGLPWTDVFGGGYKWIQKQTNTGYPISWSGKTLRSTIKNEPIPLDQIIDLAKQLQLKGEVEISLPQSPKGVYSISNKTSHLQAMHKYHFDQYSGKQLYHGTWSNIGILMKGRLWVMAFHQGQFGLWNFILVFITAIALGFLSIAGFVSYIKRKQKGQLSLPPNPKGLQLNRLFLGFVFLLAICLPLFGLSIITIYVIKNHICKS